MNKIYAGITGVNGYVPDYILTNSELETLVDTKDEWILSRTGIKERRILKGENKGSSVMGIEAVKGLLEKTKTNPLDVEVLLCATTTPDMLFPATANIISNATGLKNAFSYDIQAACSGFLYAFTTASQFIETGKYKKIIVVGVDKMSSIIDYTDRKTCIIFGDGGGAVLLEPVTDGTGLQDFILHSDGAGEQYLHMKAGGSRKPASLETVNNKEHFVYQDGTAVFKYAVYNMADVVSRIMQKNNLSSSDIAWLVPHQANKRIIDATAEKMGIGMEKVMLNIHKYGNTTSGTIPLCLWDYEKQLRKGDNLVFASFGGGFTWGAAYVKWSKD